MADRLPAMDTLTARSRVMGVADALRNPMPSLYQRALGAFRFASIQGATGRALLARHRYRLFGRSATSLRPSPGHAARFLD